MASTIDMTSAMTALSRMMGKRTLPQGDLTDWQDYVQTAFDYAWRYYQWDWSLRYVTVDLASDPYLPEDFDIGGYREAMPDQSNVYTEVTLQDYTRLPAGLQKYALQFDPTLNRYKVLQNSGLSTLDFVYQIAPPNLSDKDTNGVYVPAIFPSAMTIGIGASIWAKQGENPTRADISQEWDEFHKELNRHVGRVSKNVRRQLNINLQDDYGTYTGDTRY